MANFENLYKEKGFTEFKCSGRHPWNGKKCNCNQFPVAKQRGASAIYFPCRVSSLIIPLNITENREKVEGSSAFINTVEPTLMGCEDEEEKQEMLALKIVRWSSRIATETGIDAETVEKVIKDIFSDKQRQSYSLLQ